MDRMTENKTKKLVLVSLFIALQVVLTRLTGIEITQNFRLAGTFLALAINGALLGPVTAGVSSMIADVIGFMLKPTGPFFPGFTITAGLSGFAYGFFLYKKEPNFKNIVKATATVTFINNLLINSLWISMLFHLPYIGQIKVRFLGEVGVFIIKTVVLTLVLPKILRALKRG